MVREEAVSEVVTDELLVAAEAHNAAQQLLVEVHYLPELLSHLVLLPLEVVVGRPLVLRTHIHARHLLVVAALLVPLLVLLLYVRLRFYRNVVFLHCTAACDRIVRQVMASNSGNKINSCS